MAQLPEVPSRARIALYMRRRLREFEEKQRREGGPYTADVHVADAIGVHRSPFSRFVAGETFGADKIVPGLMRLMGMNSYDELHEKVRKEIPEDPIIETAETRLQTDPRYRRLHVALEHARMSGLDEAAIAQVEQDALKSDVDLTPEQWREQIMDAVRARAFGRRNPAALARAAAQAEARARARAEDLMKQPSLKERSAKKKK